MGDPDLLPEGWNGEGDDDPDPVPDLRSSSLNEEMDDMSDPPISLAAGDRSRSRCEGVVTADPEPLGGGEVASRLSKNPDPTRFGK